MHEVAVSTFLSLLDLHRLPVNRHQGRLCECEHEIAGNKALDNLRTLGKLQHGNFVHLLPLHKLVEPAVPQDSIHEAIWRRLQPLDALRDMPRHIRQLQVLRVVRVEGVSADRRHN